MLLLKMIYLFHVLEHSFSCTFGLIAPRTSNSCFAIGTTYNAEIIRSKQNGDYPDGQSPFSYRSINDREILTY